MSLRLPPVASRDDYRAALKQTEPFEAAVRHLSAVHGFPAAPLSRFSNGSTPVFAAGEAHVVKFYGPLYLDTFRGEVAALSHVHGRLGVPTPGVVASGTLDGWGYVVMDRLRGRELREMWDEMGPDDQLAAVRRTGEAAARLHALSVDGLEALDVGWAAWTARQRETAVERHREKELGEEWLAQFPAWLDTVEMEPDGPPPMVLLHTELMRDHVLADRAGEGWEVTGLIDFEPAMLGCRDYEMASVGLFVARGDPALLRAFLEGYGVDPRGVDDAARRRWLAWAILHRYGNLRWYLEFMPMPEERTLDALARRWWATE